MTENIKSAFWPGWETVGIIGHGSFGAVYEIRRTIRGRTEHAALKVITIPQDASEIEALRADDYDDESITRYFADNLDKIESEYAVMADMKGHANVVYCDDIRSVQNEDGFGWHIYIKMELLTPLKNTVSNAVTDEQVIRLGVDMCNALTLCKQLNIVHRDIKPENIFVARDGNYKLGDFGIAKTMENTSGGTKTGTYDYMAPEVYNNRPYHSEADIYSLGLVMYWMLNERTAPFLPISAQRPTPSMKAAARERRFCGEAIPAPKYGSDALKRIVLKACAFDPADRYTDPAQMKADLQALLYHQELETTVRVEDNDEKTVYVPVNKTEDKPVDIPADAPEYKPDNTPKKTKTKKLWPIICVAGVALICLVCLLFTMLPNKTKVDEENPYLERTMDAQGRIIKTTYKDPDGDILAWYESHYDSDGNETRRDGYYADGTPMFTYDYKYEKSVTTIHRTCYDVDTGEINWLSTKTLQYDEFGNIIRTEEDCTEMGVDAEPLRYEYEYDEEHRVIKSTTAEISTIWEYIDDGKTVKEITMWPNGEKNDVTLTFENGKLISSGQFNYRYPKHDQLAEARIGDGEINSYYVFDGADVPVVPVIIIGLGQNGGYIHHWINVPDVTGKYPTSSFGIPVDPEKHEHEYQDDEILGRYCWACGDSAEASVVDVPTDTFADEPAKDNAHKKTVGVLLPADYVKLWEMMGEQLQAEMNELHYESVIAYADDNPETQAIQVKQLVDEGVDALVIMPIDPADTSLMNACEYARECGVIIIANERQFSNKELADCCLQPDMGSVGRLQAEAIIGNLEFSEPRNIEIISGSTNDPNARVFYDSAMEVLQPYINDGRLIVQSGQTDFEQTAIDGWDSSKAQARMDNVLSAYYAEENLDAVLVAADCLSQGVINSLEAFGYGEENRPFPIVTGQDAELAAIRNIIAGKQTMTVFFDPQKNAEGIASLVAGLFDNEGENVKPLMASYSATAIDASNVNKLIELGLYTEEQLGLPKRTFRLKSLFGGSAEDVSLRVGETFALALVDEQGNTVSGVNWNVRNGTACTVENGTVEATASGNCQIVATYNGEEYICIVRVN